jgi:hypothetical protein
LARLLPLPWLSLLYLVWLSPSLSSFSFQHAVEALDQP